MGLFEELEELSNKYVKVDDEKVEKEFIDNDEQEEFNFEEENLEEDDYYYEDDK